MLNTIRNSRRVLLLVTALPIATAVGIAIWGLNGHPSGPVLLSLPTAITESRDLDDTADRAARLNHSPQADSGILTIRRVTTLEGDIVHLTLKPDERALVFVFLGVECPISNALIPEMNAIAEQYAPRGVRLFGVISDHYVTRQQAAAHRDAYDVQFPVIIDASGLLCQQLRATHTPQAVVVGDAGRIVYSGLLNDRFVDLAAQKSNATRSYLREALQALERDAAVTVPHTVPVGCPIESFESQVPRTELTFTHHVAPIIHAHCTECHREGESAPFVLKTYDDVRQHATQIGVVIERDLMPPWRPVADFGHFLNERRLTETEKQILRNWIAGGMPSGDLESCPPAPQFPSDWHLGQPDLILEMPVEYQIPATGPDIYRHFIIPSGLTRNRLVAAMEFRPGNATVVHHAIVYCDTHGAARALDEADPGPGYSHFGSPGFTPDGSLGGWGPGGTPRRLPRGCGRVMWKDADVVLQIHYHPTGKPERDRSRIGLHFAEDAAQKLVAEISVANVDLHIPAGAANHWHYASYTLPVDTWLLDASPHMHVLGREMKVEATTPDGQVVPLIWIDDWSFYWQDHYVYREPIALPAGTRIDVAACFDNSTANPLNPHAPPVDVHWGDNSTDEMAICYFQVTTRTMPDFLALVDHSQRYFNALLEQTRTPARRTPSPRENSAK